MFKFKLYLLSFSLIAFSAQAMELTWDDPESGTGLHVSAVVKDKEDKPYKVEETQLKHIPFYQNLFGNADVVKLMGDGTILTPEEAAQYVKTSTDRFAKGIPLGRITIVKLLGMCNSLRKSSGLVLVNLHVPLPLTFRDRG